MIVDPDFCDHWKTRMLVSLLGDDEAAPVYVLRIWSHCQMRRQCNFDNLTSEALKALCRFTGDSQALETALTAAGFIRRDNKVLSVCNWEAYNQRLIAAWSNGAKGGRKPDKNPAVTEPGVGFHREEKRRVEKKRKKTPADEPPQPRPRDELFDTLAEVTSSDPTTNGPNLGRICKKLREAKPPYTPEEVRRLPAILDAQGWPSFTFTLNCVLKYISWVRSPPKKTGASSQPGEPVDPDAETRRLREEVAARRAKASPPPGKGDGHG